MVYVFLYCFMSCLEFLYFFFVSSRRRHTRFDCDWSSDVCASDLFASCAICHYGRDKSDRGVHLVQITNAAGQTEQVLRKTPSLLKAHADGPYGADGRFATVQEAAHAAIVSPVE